MAVYSADTQVVNPGESVVFTETVEPCNRGLIRHRDGTPTFLLSGAMARRSRCCQPATAKYMVNFGANLSVPEGGTAGAISVALSIDGSTLPASTMTVTPAAVQEEFNVSRAINLQVWSNCCETVSVRNVSSQPIQIGNPIIDITRPDLVVSR